MQELNQYKDLPTTIEEDEAFEALEKELEKQRDDRKREELNNASN